MPDVLVSYSRRDSEFVNRLARSLEAREREVWVDVGRIEDAEVFPAAIRSAIESADSFILVISPDSAESQYCAMEVDYAGTGLTATMTKSGSRITTSALGACATVAPAPKAGAPSRPRQKGTRG